MEETSLRSYQIRYRPEPSFRTSRRSPFTGATTPSENFGDEHLGITNITFTTVNGQTTFNLGYIGNLTEIELSLFLINLNEAIAHYKHERGLDGTA